ncbi:MAG: transposase [Deltaproteobacteria bacterium]|nr:transposase [Deltaproteobacteria bacterium]
MARRLPNQLAITLPNTWGGPRKGAGRKPTGPKAGISHKTRPFHSHNHPVHVTLRVARDLPSLREWRVAKALGTALKAAARVARAADEGKVKAFRVVHFSLQPDHVHLIVEAGDRGALSCGMQGLAIRLARAVNGALGRRGRVFADRYHARPLKTPTEVRNCLVYVLSNFKKHVATPPRIDPCSSAPWFTGFRDLPAPPRTDEPPVVPGRTWLLSTGWRRLGLVRISERPHGVPPTPA